MAEWSGASVSHPAIVQDGGLDSRRRPETRPSLPHRCFGELELHVEIVYMRNEGIDEMWAGSGSIVDLPENPDKES